jgi:DNA-binding transcriptional MocR family regulator
MRRYIDAAGNVLGGHAINWHPDNPYIWLSLPQGWRAAAFARAAERQGVQLRTAEDFVPRDGFAPHAVRLAVNAQVSLNSFEEAVGRLRELLDNPPEAILT